jgi:hypothetical protein
LIALIAKARVFHASSIGNRRSNAFPGVKRPVLLQAHPGISAVRLKIHDWLLDKQDGDTAPLPRGISRTPRLRLVPSGPRPNALPLHNVRHRKASHSRPRLP